MHIEQLVTMANDIANFFRNGSDPGAGPRNVSDHLRRYWDPRMRKQMIAYYHSGGAGLSDLARAGIELLAATPAAAPPVSKASGGVSSSGMSSG
jgi:formate dehydrogenase subunit delta